MKRYIEVINKPLHFISVFITVISFIAIMEFNPTISSRVLVAYSLGAILLFITEYNICKKRKKERKTEIKTRQAVIFVTITLTECIITCIAGSLAFMMIRIGGVI